MTEITNKHLFVTMIIIGVITIGLIAGQYGMLGSTNRPYYYNNGLGASVYDSSYSSSGSSLNLNNRYSYVPDITRDYYAYDTTSSYSVPQTTTTTYTYSYPSETTSTQTSYYNNNSNLDAYGCAPGANYSVTTGQSCYGYNNYNNNG